jgi:hypothetical protein
MKKKRAMSNSRDPNYPYTDMPVTSEEEEAWLLLAAREAFELQERESKKPKPSSPGQLISPVDPIDSSD